MQIDNPDLFSVVLPTFNGTPFVKRTLDYLRHLQFKGRIVLSDNSSGSCREWIASCATAYRDLNLEAFQFDERITFLDKLIQDPGATVWDGFKVGWYKIRMGLRFRFGLEPA